MDELAVFPLVGQGAEVLDLVEPLDRPTEFRDRLVLLVEQCHAGLELGDDHQALPGVEVGRETEARDRVAVGSVEGERLQRVVRPVADHDRGLTLGAVCRGTAVDPDAVGRVERALAVAGSAERAQPLRIFVVAVHRERAVAVGEEKTAVVEKGEVRGQEALPVPGGRGGDVFAQCVNARLHRRFAKPDDLAVERQLREGLHALVAADVEEFRVAFFANLDAVAASLKLAAERPDECARRVEHEDGRVVFLILVALVDHVQIARRIDGDAMRGLPGEPVGQLRKTVVHPKRVCPRADDDVGAHATAAGEGGRGRDCHGPCRQGGERAPRDPGQGATVERGHVRLLRATDRLKSASLARRAIKLLKYYGSGCLAIDRSDSGRWRRSSGATSFLPRSPGKPRKMLASVSARHVHPFQVSAGQRDQPSTAPKTSALEHQP